MEEWLLKASINQLRDFLRGRFQGIGPHAADTGTPVAELPPDLPLELWQVADEDLRSRLVQAIEGILDEVPRDGWTPRAIEWLCFFVDLADIQPLRPRLSDVARSQRWLKRADDGPRCHVALLRTLLDLNWVAERDFWLDLPTEVHKRFPGIVFRGLLGHDIDAAFAYLRRAVEDAEHARQVVTVLGDVMDDATLRARVIEQLRCALPELPRAVSAYLTKWFRIYGWGDLAQQDGQPQPVANGCSHTSAFDSHVGWRREELLPTAAMA